MSTIKVGDPIKIERSGGRIQWALIQDIREESGILIAGWLEQYIAKWKKVNFESAAHLNPNILFLQEPAKSIKTPVIQRQLHKRNATGKVKTVKQAESIVAKRQESKVVDLSSDASEEFEDNSSNSDSSSEELSVDAAFEAYDKEEDDLARARKAIGDTLVTMAHSYVVVLKKKLEVAGDNETKMLKSVIRWGQTSKLHPYDRWAMLKSYHTFSVDDYAMILVNKWTNENLPDNVRDREEASILDEFLIEAHKESFMLHKSISSGQGMEMHNKQMKALVTDERVQSMRERLLEVLSERDYVLSTGHYHCTYEGCDFRKVDKKKIVDHILTEHFDADAPKPKYPCSKCSEIFNTITLRISHQNAVHNKPPPCSVKGCKYQAINRSNAKRHLVDVHNWGEKRAHLAVGMKSKKSYKS